jgi:hypothetical protein
VEKASFTGTYSIKEIDGVPELQTNNFSGICYAWRQENGITIVLPVGRDNLPHGNCYLVDDRDFAFLFQPYDATAPASDDSIRPPLRAGAPDLLGMWYEQSLASPSSVPAPQTDRRESGGSQSFAAVSNDETLFAPAWHPDELFHEPEDSTPPSAVPAPGADQDASAPAAQMYVEEEPEDPESRSARLEQRMRVKFAVLLQATDENAELHQDEEIARLLTLGSSFSWRQKFMFTEFGLALRRKQKFALALDSHLRALELAPNDEHILFNVARAEYELRNTDRARHYLDKALSVAPDFAVAKNFKNFLNGRA